MDTPVFVLTGNVPGLAVIRGLSLSHVPVVLFYYDEDDTAQSSKHVIERVKTAPPTSQERAFVDLLIGWGKRYPGALIMPTSDEALVVASRFKDELAAHFVVACPGYATVQTCVDKELTRDLSDEHQLLGPRTIVPSSEGDAVEAAHDLGFPLLVKPATGHLYKQAFGKKMTEVHDIEQLKRAYTEAEDADLTVMLQEWIPGDDTAVINYNAYCWEGEVLAEFTARHVRKAPTRFGSPRVVVSEWIPEAAVAGRSVMTALRYCGFGNVEMKYDARDGRYRLIEINARHNMSGVLAVRCGLNFPLIEYRHRLEGELPQPVRQTDGMYWCNNFQDLSYSLRFFREEGLTVSRFLHPYLSPHCDAILDRRDLGPFRTRLGYVGRKVAGSAVSAAGRRVRIRR